MPINAYIRAENRAETNVAQPPQDLPQKSPPPQEQLIGSAQSEAQRSFPGNCYNFVKHIFPITLDRASDILTFY